MEARLEHDWQRDSWNIYLTDRAGEHGARRVMKPIQGDDGLWSVGFVTITEGVAGPFEPTLTLRSDWLEAIVKAGNEEAGILVPNHAMANHLADAVGVRDRLLKVVEETVNREVVRLGD